MSYRRRIGVRCLLGIFKDFLLKYLEQVIKIWSKSAIKIRKFILVTPFSDVFFSDVLLLNTVSVWHAL